MINIFADRTKVLENGCWGWIGYKNPKGYGITYLNGKRGSVHRLMYEFYVKSIPEDLVVHHKCNNRACINPDHLEALSIEKHCEIHINKKVGKHNATKTHCKLGHELSGENLMLIRRNGVITNRECRACHNARRLRNYHRNKTC